MTNSVGNVPDMNDKDTVPGTVIELARQPAEPPGSNTADAKDVAALAHAEMEASGASRNQAALSHAQAVGDVVLIHGSSGWGKTWAARHHCAGRAGAVFLSVTGACVTLSGLLHRLSDAAGAGGRHGSALEAETAIVSRLADRGALIVIDEAHHLRAHQIDELRCIRDMGNCGLALIGDDSVRMTLARCPQVMGPDRYEGGFALARRRGCGRRCRRASGAPAHGA